MTEPSTFTGTLASEEEPDITPADVVRPLPSASIRLASRLPSVFVLYAWELVVALIVATPLHGVVRATLGAHPDGDAGLFAPGGRVLVGLLDAAGVAVPVATRATLAVVVVAMLALQLPLGALLAAFVTGRGAERRSLPQRALFREATGAFMPLASVFVIGAIVQVVLVGAGMTAAGATMRALAPRYEDLHALWGGLAVAAVFLVPTLLLSPFLDVARVAVVRSVVLAEREPTTRASLAAAARAVFRLPRRLKVRAVGAWAGRAALGGVLVVVAASLVDRGLSVAALWLVDQAVVLARTVLRASWLAHASRAVASAEP